MNTFIQYNYSHDNLWFCGIMKKRNRNVVIRYNVSQNDRKGIYFYGFENRKEASGIHIYNNTHFIRRGLDVSVFPEGRTPINSRFENNIFFFEGKGSWGAHPEGVNLTWSDNLYYGIAPHPSDLKALTADPRFYAPGSAGTNISLVASGPLSGYQLRANSPCINRGARIDHDGGRYFLREKGPEAGSHIGAFDVKR